MTKQLQDQFELLRQRRKLVVDKALNAAQVFVNQLQINADKDGAVYLTLSPLYSHTHGLDFDIRFGVDGKVSFVRIQRDRSANQKFFSDERKSLQTQLDIVRSLERREDRIGWLEAPSPKAIEAMQIFIDDIIVDDTISGEVFISQRHISSEVHLGVRFGKRGTCTYSVLGFARCK